MKNVRNIVLAVTITFILNVALNFGVDYFSQSNGTVLVGPAITIQGKLYQPLTISNYNSSILDDIVLSVPNSVTASELVSSDPIRVNPELTNAGNTERKQISLSGIEHNHVTIVQIPLTSIDQLRTVGVMNAKQKKLEVLKTSEISYPYTQALINAIILSIIYAAIYGLFLMWAHTQFTEMEKIARDLRESGEKTDLLLIEFKNRNAKKEAENSEMFTRVKLLLLARLADYSQELRFWRDTMRRVLYGLSGGPEAGDEIVKLVTESLKTYGTRTDYKFDFDATKVLAGLIYRSEVDIGKDAESRS